MRTLFYVCLFVIGIHSISKGQKDATYSGPELFVEASASIMSGLANANRDLVDKSDFSSNLGLGWGLGLQSSLIFQNGYGLVFSFSNDVFGIRVSEDDEIEKGIPKIVRQSIYQGITHIQPYYDYDKIHVEWTLAFGWTRYRVPTIKYENSAPNTFDNVSGFSTQFSGGLLYQYSEKSRLRFGCTVYLDFIDYEWNFKQNRRLDDTEMIALRLTLGHITRI